MSDLTTIEHRTAATGGSQSVAAMRICALRQVHPPVAEGDRMLDRAPVVLGRSPGPGGYPIAETGTSRRHAVIEFDPATGRHRLRDLGSRNGTRLNGEAVEQALLSDGDVIRISGALFVYVTADLAAGSPLPTLQPGLGLARAVLDARVALLARAPLSVLIIGETGAGKERLAQRIHSLSGRAGRFVPVNCGALSGELLASELFGHVRGAFSGADRARTGLVASADRGTLFLDEIAELPLERQPTLLRVLQEKRVRPVGSDRTTPVDLRVIAATHTDLDAAVAEGRFRDDLVARLAGVTLQLPPLRARRDEILALFDVFVEGRPLGLRVAEALLRHDWPRNVRELEHVATHARAFAAPGATVELGHLPESMQRPSGPAPAPPARPPIAPRSGRARQPPRAHLEALMRAHRGNVTHVAEALGVQRNQAYRWLKKLGIDAADFRGG